MLVYGQNQTKTTVDQRFRGVYKAQQSFNVRICVLHHDWLYHCHNACYHNISISTMHTFRSNVNTEGDFGKNVKIMFQEVKNELLSSNYFI